MSSEWVKKSYWGIVKAEHFIGHFLLLVIRLYWGGLLVLAGLGKLGNASEVASFFEGIHIPFPLLAVYLVGIFEFLGGISLFFGFFTRIMTIPLVVIFVVAYFSAHGESLVTFFSNPSLFVMQAPFLFLYTTLVVLSFGSGMISVDYWLEKRGYNKDLSF